MGEGTCKSARSCCIWAAGQNMKKCHCVETPQIQALRPMLHRRFLLVDMAEKFIL